MPAHALEGAGQDLLLAAMDDFGAEMARLIGEPDPGQSALERFERFWTRVIDSFQASSQVWLATFDIFTVAQRDPEVRAAVAEGLEDGRKLWARLLYGVDDTDGEKTRAIGSLHQALVSGVLVQWLIDPGRAPSSAQLALGMQAIADQVAASQPAPARLASPLSQRSCAGRRRSRRRIPTGSAARCRPAAPWAGSEQGRLIQPVRPDSGDQDLSRSTGPRRGTWEPW